tara:strand:+ start:72 stop:407 length:336 start_codon:yes stop_codon:yes gene_type:complete
MKDKISFEVFDSVDFRVGTILSASFFEKARNPAYKLLIDFGRFGKINSSAQITEIYSPSQLIGKQIIAVVNIGERKILNYVSQCLVLGVSTKDGIVLLEPKSKIQNGSIVL